MAKTDSDVKLIKNYFNASMDEIKALTPSDRQELGAMIRATLPEE